MHDGKDRGSDMKTAKQILKKKMFIKHVMDTRLENSDELWEKAMVKLEQILRKYAYLSKEERLHPEGYIFPSAAIYLTLKDVVGMQEAYDIIEIAAVQYTLKTGELLAKAVRIPGFRSVFIRIWDPMTKKMFGPERGFRNVFYPKKKDEYRMDIIACPYVRYFTELGCPEITKIFCDNDDRCYGNIPGLEFKRSSTLGKGGDRCDFYIRKV